ncbi:MAG TPA: tripartite tricarboxylate transporter substrate binding protein [Burkholderiales bacterium]|nr:tripartite tricarboxylate transporter substrate binding protein [Burkholderiales bacterium]
MVVPFPPGGGTDIIARTLGDRMAADLGQPVIIDNRPGAGTMIGDDNIAKSAPDGYSLLIATFAHAVNPSLQAKIPFNTEKDFAPVALVGRSPNVLIVNPNKPFKSVADVLAFARANPGKLTFGSFGNGTSAHLAGELFKNLAKVDMVHVPYKGSAPALTDLLGGQIDMMFTTVASVAQYIKGNRLRALAVTSAQRSTAYPNLPTIGEAGVPGYAAESWYGIYVPAGTPAPIIARLSQSVHAAVKTEAFKSRIEEEGLMVSSGTPEELAKYVQAEEIRWAKVVKEARIQVD